MNEKNLLKIANDNFTEFTDSLSQCEFFTLDGNCEIKYMSNYKNTWNTLLCGLMSVKFKKDKSIIEKDKLRINTKNYFKLFYQNKILLKVESYVNGKIGHIYLCYYFNNLRILKPFTENGGFYPTYSLITVYSKNNVIKEILLNNTQIIIETYIYKNNYVEYECANLIPCAPKHKILSYSKGIITDTLNYCEQESFAWHDNI